MTHTQYEGLIPPFSPAAPDTHILFNDICMHLKTLAHGSDSLAIICEI